MADRSIAHYNLLERIGDGGLGVVYRARDTRVGRTVALKVIEPALITDDTRRIALFDEARVASRLSHPNIATLFEVGEGDGASYLAYEFVSGRPLRNEIAGRPMPPRRAVEITISVADALADGHAAGVIHGDLRPETILVTGKGSAKLLDFGFWRWTRGGLTRRAAARAPESLPDEDARIATYMAPEQALGSDVDGRADVFSLGTILYELLTGVNPFAATTVQGAVMNVITKTPPVPSTVNAGVPAELDALTARALTKDLSLRVQSAAAFSAELRRVASSLNVQTFERKDDYLLPVDEPADKLPAVLWIAGFGAVAVVGVLIWWALKV